MTPKDWAKFLQKGGALAIGIGGLMELFGFAEEEKRGRGGLGSLPARGDPMTKLLPPGKVLSKATKHEVSNINERVSYIRKLILKGSESPRVRDAAAQILNQKCGNKWCVPAKNPDAEVAAIFKAITDPRSPFAIRYTRDHRTVDQYHAADKLLQMRIGDCDDTVILLGALLRAIGYPVKMRVIQTKQADTWSHIYLLVGIPPTARPTKWVPLDATMPEKGPGWEAPKSMIVRVKDFEV